ncbi:TPA: tyrosine-type recombinase/integrase [Salmonella enterica]|nr:pilus assembly protein [Salmonella enterica]HAK8631637.1 tyrosine-type recombinase/integrase [Salmonella enterica]
MKKRKFLTHHEVGCLLGAIRESRHPERNSCMVLLAYVHGLRTSELLGMKLSDLELSGRRVQVRRMKNGFSTVHPLLKEEVKVLRRWLDIRKGVLREAEVESEMLFVSGTGKVLSRQQFYNILSAAGKKAELSTGVHPHMLRHACGYSLADNGIDTRLIQDYLGHRNIRHTVLYTASSAARFERVWQGPWRRKKQLFDPKCKPLHGASFYQNLHCIVIFFTTIV